MRKILPADLPIDPKPIRPTLFDAGILSFVASLNDAYEVGFHATDIVAACITMAADVRKRF